MAKRTDPPASGVSVVLAIPHPLCALGVRTAIRQFPEFEIVAECYSAASVLKSLRRFQPRVLVCGSGPWGDRIHGMASIRAASPETLVVVLCTGQSDLSVEAMLEGANGVFPADVTIAHFVQGLRTLLAGKRLRLRVSAGGNGDELRRGPRTPTVLARLTARERQIAQGVVVGKRNKEIAVAFGIAPGTVKLHLNKIYGKLGVNSRLGLLRKLVDESVHAD